MHTKRKFETRDVFQNLYSIYKSMLQRSGASQDIGHVILEDSELGIPYIMYVVAIFCTKFGNF